MQPSRIIEWLTCFMLFGTDRSTALYMPARETWTFWYRATDILVWTRYDTIVTMSGLT